MKSQLVFLTVFLAVIAARADDVPVTISVDTNRVLSHVSPHFIGFGYETSAVAQPGYFAASNTTLIRLYDNLSPHGLIRIGGNVSDHTRYIPDGIAVARTERDTTVINQASLQSLGDFARATGWQIMWGLNLGSRSKDEAVQEALAVDAALGTNLHSFEIGNEVDALHRFSGNYDAYHAAFIEYKAAIRAALPHAKFSGPDVIGNWRWITNFVDAEHRDMQLLTQHYYRGGAGNTNSTLERLLQNDHGFAERLRRLHQLCQPYGLRFRINEVNSYSGGGKRGVSDTFGSALWCLDYLCKLAASDCGGVNIETDINQLGFLSHYSPIVHDASGHCSVRPEYYGMLAFALLTGDNLPTPISTTNINLTAYAARHPDGSLWVAVINKDFSHSARVSLHLPNSATQCSIFRLTAPSIQSTNHVTFAGSEVASDGSFDAKSAEDFPIANNFVRFDLPFASAALVRAAVTAP